MRARLLTAADELRDEYKRRKKAGAPPKAGWKDAIRYLEDRSLSDDGSSLAGSREAPA